MPAISWKSDDASLSAPTGRKRLSSIARRIIACSSRPSSPISSRNSMPLSAVRSSPGRSAAAPVKAPLRVAEQRRHRAVALQRRAVHLDERARRPDASAASVRRCAARAGSCRRRSAPSAASARASAAATCSISSIIRLKAALRVSMPDFRNERALRALRRRSAWRCCRSATDRGRSSLQVPGALGACRACGWVCSRRPGR